MKENDEIDFSEEAFKKRWKVIDKSQLPFIPKFTSLRDCKSRITIYLDADIVIHFKEIAEKENAGYQTLINETLRQVVDGQRQEREKQELKDDLLKDKKFLRKLRTALAA